MKIRFVKTIVSFDGNVNNLNMQFMSKINYLKEQSDLIELDMLD